MALYRLTHEQYIKACEMQTENNKPFFEQLEYTNPIGLASWDQVVHTIASDDSKAIAAINENLIPIVDSGRTTGFHQNVPIDFAGETWAEILDNRETAILATRKSKSSNTRGKK